ncbi:MAG: topoisomerase C-terminal repeat-containing protein [Bacteroidia bacterium]
MNKKVVHAENAERAGGERELGNHPKSGKPVIARLGRFGPMIQIGSSDDEEKPQYSKLRPNQRLETITLEEALELFKLPRVLGEMEGQDVKVNIGRYGPYVPSLDGCLRLWKMTMIHTKWSMKER